MYFCENNEQKLDLDFYKKQALAKQKEHKKFLDNLKKDIERISKHLRLSPADFEKKYLRVDEDNDKVLQCLPCPFLAEDNTCLIYDIRPKACREYPHTDRKKIYQINHLTIKNTIICPAAYLFVEKMMKRMQK